MLHGKALGANAICVRNRVTENRKKLYLGKNNFKKKDMFKYSILCVQLNTYKGVQRKSPCIDQIVVS